MKKILIPVDFSEQSEEALKVAAQIARKHKCELILLHLLELPEQKSPISGKNHTIPEIMLHKEQLTKKLETLMETKYLEGLSLYQAFGFDKVTEGIIDCSLKNDVDLIIMGSKGTSGFDEIFVGSNTEKVVRLSSIPVLVIKKSLEEFKAEKFIFASDFSKDKKESFKKVLRFVDLFQSKLALVMICTPYNFKTTSEAEKTIAEFTAGFDIKNYTSHIYNDNNVENGILHFAQSIDADMIAICTYGKSALSRLLNGSVSESVTNHAIRPLLTFKI
jgi:nucleotide-binding universal stress UspA family protein